MPASDAISAALSSIAVIHGLTVNYSRGGDVIEGITATPGQTRTTQIDESGIYTKIQIRDYFIPAAALQIDDVSIEPAQGDRIEEADGTVYEVHPIAGEPCFRFADPARTVYRIHTKKL